MVYSSLPEFDPLALHKKSTKFPQLQGFPHLGAFLQKMTEDINELQLSDVLEQNLSLQQTEALRQLGALDKVVIKPSDKGGNIALMNST